MTVNRPSTEIYIDHILTCVCEFYGVNKEEVKGKSREPHLVKARKMFFHMGCSFEFRLKGLAALINRRLDYACFANRKLIDESRIYKDVKEDVEAIRILITEKLKL